MRCVARRVILALCLTVVLSLPFAAVPAPAGAVVVEISPCPVDFSAAPTSGYAPLFVEFTDETEWCVNTTAADTEPETLPCEWVITWDYGDGSSAVRHSGLVEEVPPFDSNHTYTQPGKYTVSLTYEWVCEVPEGGDSVSRSFVFSKVRRVYIEVLERDKGRELEPAKMLVSYLNIDPQQVLPGQEVVVSANVCNGGEEDGTKTASLAVNGVAEQSQTVGVSGGSCQQVSFRLSRAVPGTYQVSIDGMVGQFSVLAPRTVTNAVAPQQGTGLGAAGIAAIVAVAVALIIALVVLFKKA